MCNTVVERGWTHKKRLIRRFCFFPPPRYFINSCVNQAAAYGKCVTATTTGTQELKKDVCSKEFGALKTCFMNAVSDSRKHSTEVTGF